MNTLLLLGIAVLWLSLLTDIIAIAIPYWVFMDSETMEMNQGLFQTCIAVVHLIRSSKQCAYIDTDTTQAWWIVVQCMVLLSVLTISSAVGLAALAFMLAESVQQKRFLGLLSALMGVASAGLIIVGVIVYAVKMRDFNVDFHAGFVLAIIAAVLAIVGSTITFFSRYHDTESRVNVRPTPRVI